MFSIRTALATALLLSFSSAPQAALFDRGGGMIYDDVLDITWLRDANLGGLMTWGESAFWADNLGFGGYDNWRLPNLDLNLDGTMANCTTASEAACQDNELGYMYYHNLGGMLRDDLTGNQGPFENIQEFHWSSTAFAGDPGFRWGFVFDFGVQVGEFTGFSFGAWAVRDGDVAVIPLPASVWLLGSGLLGIAGLTRRNGDTMTFG